MNHFVWLIFVYNNYNLNKQQRLVDETNYCCCFFLFLFVFNINDWLQKIRKEKKTYVTRSCVLDFFFFFFYHLPQNVDIFAIDNVVRATRLQWRKRKYFFFFIVVFVSVGEKKQNSIINPKKLQLVLYCLIILRGEKKMILCIYTYSLFILWEHIRKRLCSFGGSKGIYVLTYVFL
jgi:hypothetical protein